MTPTSSTDQEPGTRRGPGFAVAAVVAWLALVPVGFFYAAAGLVVPGPWLFLMWLLYLGLVVGALLLTRRRSYLLLAVPVLGGLLWWAVVSAGEAWLGWTG